MVHGIVGAGFGDLWASLHWCYRLAEKQASPVTISEWVGSVSTRTRLVEMQALINAPRSLVIITSDRPTLEIGYDCWETKYYQTSPSWNKSDSIPGLVAYQFDGRSTAEHKNPPRADIEKFLHWIEASGRNGLRVGQPFSMHDCLRMMLSCECFVGACSGMSTLAIASGIPTHVVAYKMGVSYWYGPNAPVICADLPGFMRQMDPPSGEVSLSGSWLTSCQAKIDLTAGGGARWSDRTHSVPGTWSGWTIHWENGFEYRCTPLDPDLLRIDEIDPSGFPRAALHAQRIR